MWNLGEEPTAGSLVLGRSDTESAGKGRVTAGGSEVQLLPLGDTRSVESAVADLTSVYSRRDGLVRRSSGFRRQIVVDHLKLGASASLVNSTDKVFEDVLKDNLAQPIQSMKTREEKGNLALASSMKKDKLPTGRKLPRVSGVFAGAKDCQWTVVTSDPSLTAAGLFPLADISAPFKASLLKPMKIPRSVKVLMIPQTRLSPLRKFNFYEPDKPMTPPKKTST